jgi:septum formation protein
MGDGTRRLILGSRSQSRRQMLTAAGLAVEVMPSRIDEDAIKAALRSEHATVVGPEEFARHAAAELAREKALAVGRDNADAVVIGADQTLLLLQTIDGRLLPVELDKPEDIAAARRQLINLRGSTHLLTSAVALVEAGGVVWEHSDTARLTMRDFSDAFLDDYLARAGADLLASVGAYRLEGLGMQLFERIEGDYFTILGMPLLPLLAELRRRKVIAT